MYTPARSDLIALALAALAAALLMAVLQSTDSAALGIAAFALVPFAPLAAAWLSGPSHSMASRFLFRGIAGVAGMAAAVVAAATVDDSEAASPLFALIWAVPLASFAFLLVLITHTLLRLYDIPTEPEA